MYRRILVSVVFSVVALSSTGCVFIGLPDFGSRSLEEHEVSRDGAFTRSKVLIVDISGPIRAGERGGLFSRATTPSSVKAILKKAAEDRHVKAIVLRIDSPGGEATATDVVYHEIMAFKERTGIPVYASIMSLGTSGAYYVGATADEIYSHPTSIVGSIGVIARIPQVSELADKIGYSQIVFKSGKNKDMGDPLQDMPEEQRVIFQKTIDSMYERFLEVVVASRPAFETKDDLRAVADGSIYTPEEAVRIELVDGIAYLDEVIEKAKHSAGVEKAKVVTYSHRGGRDSNIYSKLISQVNLLNIDLPDIFGDGLPGFHYLWIPAE